MTGRRIPNNNPPDRGQQVFNVLAYGADPSGTRDSAVGINAAIAAARAASPSGGRVFVPPGTYKLSSAVSVYPNVRFEGAGSVAVILTPAANLSHPITVVEAAVPQAASQGWNYHLSGFSLDGSAGGIDVGVWLADNAIKGHMQDVMVYGCAIGFANENHNQSWMLDKCAAYSNTDKGFYFQKLCQETTLRNCTGFYNLNYNCYLDGATTAISTFTLADCDFETGTTAALGETAINVYADGVRVLWIPKLYSESHDATSRVLKIGTHGPSCVVLGALFANGSTGDASAALYPIEWPNDGTTVVHLVVLEYRLTNYDAAGAGTAANDIICNAAGTSIAATLNGGKSAAIHSNGGTFTGISAPRYYGASPTFADVVLTREVTFTETANSGTYTGSVTVPAGSTIHDIKFRSTALWTASTSATLNVGDGGNASGWYASINLKATDLLVGEELNFTQAGGKPGSYLDLTTGKRSAAYVGVATTISGVVTTVDAGSGTAGRSRMLVVYSVPSTVMATAATKV